MFEVVKGTIQFYYAMYIRISGRGYFEGNNNDNNMSVHKVCHSLMLQLNLL